MPPHNGNLERFLQPQPQPVGLVAAPAINDVQLVALVASKREDLSPGQAVRWAQEVVAEAIVRQDRFAKTLAAMREAAAKAAGAE